MLKIDINIDREVWFEADAWPGKILNPLFLLHNSIGNGWGYSQIITLYTVYLS